MYILYPAINKEGKVFALLIQGCEQLPSLDAPRYIHGLLKVYSNYLELIRQTQTDKLTGLLNRETLDKEITRALIKNTALKQFETSGGVVKRKTDAVGYWVGLLDIDHFKNINDVYGHLFGDEVLILVSRVMEKLLRNNDYIFRFGGEEFVVFLQADGLREAYSAFERIRRYIAEYSFPKLETLTVSIGVTEVRVQPGALDVVGEADVALYYAKDHGRNQVFIYEELLEKGLIKKQGSGVCDDIEIF